MKILCIDDDAAMLRILTAELRRDGHEVLSCPLAASALQAALRGEFDVALCDLTLPDIHGLELIRALKMVAPQLPIIALSALDPEPWAEAAKEAGASFFLYKPDGLDALRAELALVEQARALLHVIVADTDRMHAARLAQAFMGSGCHVSIAHSALMVTASLDLPRLPHVLIVDGHLPGAADLVAAAKGRGVTTFVLVPRGENDEPWLRAGASLVVTRPVDADALLAQARFLGASCAAR
ncbi:MAG: response regulator [Deltaproteobacteria bacterium]|nr:response regulator [Deltaproteobacteria bacterium]